jgi:hypothetical protein
MHERFIKFDFNHVEMQDVQVNFLMCDGKFNTVEYTRQLANLEVASRLPTGKPMPNQLKVRVLRARGLPLTSQVGCMVRL